MRRILLVAFVTYFSFRLGYEVGWHLAVPSPNFSQLGE